MPATHNADALVNCGANIRSIIARIDEIHKFPSASERDRIISGLRWIGVFSNEKATVRGNLLDTLCGQLEKRMSFQPGERDLVMLQHKFVVEWKDGNTVRSSVLQGSRQLAEREIP